MTLGLVECRIDPVRGWRHLYADLNSRPQTTSELTERSGPLAERAPAAESEKVSARRKQTHREDDSRRDTESVAPQRYQVRSTDPGSRAAQERRELWAGLERTAKCIQAISSLFIWKPYRDGCIYDKPMHKREIAQLPLVSSRLARAGKSDFRGR